MRRILCGLALTACGGDAFFYLAEGGRLEDGSVSDESAASEAGSDGSIGDAGLEAEPGADSAIDASCHETGVGVQAGSSACDQVMNAYCARLKTCCNGGCGQTWTDGGAACRTHFAGQGEDCSSVAFTSKNVCYGDTAVCSNAMPTAACNVILTYDPRALCGMFWGQF